jgi:DNA-binding protein HU-beta
MSKEQFVAQLQKNAGLETKAQAEAVYQTVIQTVTEELSNGKTVSFRGFGTFTVVTRKARGGVNPATGEKISIPEQRAVKFSPGKDLRETAAMLDKGLGRERLAFRELTRSVESQLSDIRAKLEAYRKNPEQFSAETKKYLQDSRDRLNKNMDEARDKFRELSEHSGEAWKEVKKGLDGAISELRESFKRAREKF